MSGLEVLTILFGVGDLISAFDAGTDFVKKYKEKRKRSHLIYAAPLEISLAAGPPAVRSEYDIGYQNFGQRLAQGDSTAKDALFLITVKMNQDLIQVLSSIVFTDQPIDFSNLEQVSDRSRLDVVDSLHTLGQRLAVVAPIKSLSLPQLEPRKLLAFPNPSPKKTLQEQSKWSLYRLWKTSTPPKPKPKRQIIDGYPDDEPSGLGRWSRGGIDETQSLRMKLTKRIRSIRALYGFNQILESAQAGANLMIPYCVFFMTKRFYLRIPIILSVHVAILFSKKGRRATKSWMTEPFVISDIFATRIRVASREGIFSREGTAAFCATMIIVNQIIVP